MIYLYVAELLYKQKLYIYIYIYIYISKLLCLSIMIGLLLSVEQKSNGLINFVLCF